MNLKSDTITISNYFYSITSQLLSAFNPEYLKLKDSSIRRESVYATVSPILYQLERDLETLPLSEFLVEEIENLKNNLKIQVIHKNRNKPLSGSIKEAINSNFIIVESKIDKLVSAYSEKLYAASDESRKKFDDVKLSRSELALFILLAEKYGLISKNHVTESDRASAFTILTNYSTETLRREISGSNKLEPFTLPLNQDKLSNLKSILVDITQEIDEHL